MGFDWDPVLAATKRQQKRIVLQALEGLDEPYRTAVHLYYWMKCSVTEIAEQLGTRPGTVKSYLYRGRERLEKIERFARFRVRSNFLGVGGRVR